MGACVTHIHESLLMYRIGVCRLEPLDNWRLVDKPGKIGHNLNGQ